MDLKDDPCNRCGEVVFDFFIVLACVGAADFGCWCCGVGFRFISFVNFDLMFFFFIEF